MLLNIKHRQHPVVASLLDKKTELMEQMALNRLLPPQIIQHYGVETLKFRPDIYYNFSIFESSAIEHLTLKFICDGSQIIVTARAFRHLIGLVGSVVQSQGVHSSCELVRHRIAGCCCPVSILKRNFPTVIMA